MYTYNITHSVASINADPRVMTLILARSHTFVEIDHEIIFMPACSLPPSAGSRRVVDSYKRKYVHRVLVKGLVKLAQEKGVVR